MPIESAIIKQNKLNHKAMSVADFRTACHEFADHYIDCLLYTSNGRR